MNKFGLFIAKIFCTEMDGGFSGINEVYINLNAVLMTIFYLSYFTELLNKLSSSMMKILSLLMGLSCIVNEQQN